MANYGGGGMPNPWGGGGNFQGNNMMGGGMNVNNQQAQLAMGLISNLLMQQQQQQQLPQMNNMMSGQQMMMGSNQPNMMGNNMGVGYGAPDNFRSRNYSPPRRRFRSPSPRRQRGPLQNRRFGSAGAPKSYKDNRRAQDNKRGGAKNNNANGKKPSEEKDKSDESASVEAKLDDAAVDDEATAQIEGASEAKENPSSNEKQSKTGDKADENDANKKKEARTGKATTSDEGAFEGLPAAAFRCHLCKKSMWDARSFENHIGGVAHQRMLDDTETMYADKAKTLRRDCQTEEDRIQRDLVYQAQVNNRPMPSRRDFCKMCDLVIYGPVLDHRRASTHQTLKNHLHPKCSTCQIDLPSRIDLDIHVLTAAHLKRLYKNVISKPENRKRERKEKPKKKIVPVGEYDPNIAVGEECMLKVTGIFCKLCRRFFLKDDNALKAHCKAKDHYDNLVEAQKEAIKKEKEEEEAEEAKKKEEDEKELLLEAEDEAVDAKKTKLEEDPNVYDPFVEEAGEVENANGADQEPIGLDEMEDEIAQTDTNYDDPQEVQQLDGFETMQSETADQYQDYEQEQQLPEGYDEQPYEEQPYEEQPADDQQEEEEQAEVPARGHCSRRGGRGRPV